MQTPLGESAKEGDEAASLLSSRSGESAWIQVSLVRRAVDAVVLPHPHDIRGGIEAGLSFDESAWGEASRWLGCAGTASAGQHGAVLDKVAGHRRRLPAAGCSADELMAADCNRAADPHDAYFRIARTREGVGVAYVRGLVQALEVFLSEAQRPDDVRDYACIGRALLELWASALGSESSAASCADLDTAPAPRRGPRVPADHAVQRWLRGHQIFAALSQGLVWTLHGLVRSHARDEHEGVRQALRRMARLYRASAAAFRFTADFEPEIYVGTIRPSMCEPHTPKGFSGTLSSDHGVLVKLLTENRSVLDAARGRFPLEFDAMRSALAEVYDDHKWVCARFDGASLPSLRTSSIAGESTAVEMLERFKARRVATLS